MHYGIDQAGVWVDCVRQRRPVIHNDYASLLHKKGMPQGHAAVVRQLVVPIMRADRIVAILGVGNKPTNYTDKDVEIVSFLADVAWVIAEHKRTEEALRESEDFLNRTGDMAKVGGWEVDLNTMKVIWTRTTGRIHELPHGYFPDLEEAINFYHSEDQDHVRQCVQRAIESAEPFDFTVRLITAKGRERWIRALGQPIFDSGSCVRLSGTFQDITERMRKDEALRETEERYGNIIENVLLGVYQTALDGKLLFANKKMVEMFGYSSFEEFEAAGSIAERYARPEERIGIVNEIIKEGSINTEVEFRRKDGQSIWVKLNTRKATNREGAIILEGLMEDVTEIKRMMTQLQQSQKMEAIGTLAGGIAHDFNNILAIIMGNAELAFDDVPNGNPVKDYLNEIRLASVRAKDMVQQLLAFSRKSDEENTPLDMAPIIKESMKMLRSAIPTSVEFKQHISDDPCKVMGDATQINQIVMNLLTNAADAMSEEGGLLEVTLDNIILQKEKPCFHWVLSPGPYVRLGIKDTGEGIEPENMDRIFDPYYTTKEVGKGTGMGLSIIHGIVKRHSGGIRVESALGKGTLFEIYFPALEKAAEEEKEPEGEIRGGSERVLFVDDEESMVNLNRQRLERLGYQVKTTTKPMEALEWFKADPDQFDIIITDMTMPRMTGDRLAAEVLKIRPHVPLIISTGYSERMSAKKVEALGVRKCIEKPIDLRNLASSLREVLDEK